MPALRVVYPHGGRVVLLHWWTYDDRGHIVLASSERALMGVARRIFTENPYAEIKGYSEVEIVAPSERLQVLAAKQEQDKRVGNFFYEITHRLYEAMEAGRELPPPFERCTNYELADPDTSDPPDEWSTARHYGCKHCYETVHLGGLTRGDLYARYHERWEAANPVSYRFEVKGRVVSRARVARDDEHLWRVCASFGPHAEGLRFEEIRAEGEPNLSTDGTLGYTSLEDEALFFYRPIQDLDVLELAAMLQVERVKADYARELREQQRKDDFEREKTERYDAIISFFKEAT